MTRQEAEAMAKLITTLGFRVEIVSLKPFTLRVTLPPPNSGQQ